MPQRKWEREREAWLLRERRGHAWDVGKERERVKGTVKSLSFSLTTQDEALLHWETKHCLESVHCLINLNKKKKEKESHALQFSVIICCDVFLCFVSFQTFCFFNNFLFYYIYFHGLALDQLIWATLETTHEIKRQKYPQNISCLASRFGG